MPSESSKACGHIRGWGSGGGMSMSSSEVSQAALRQVDHALWAPTTAQHGSAGLVTFLFTSVFSQLL